MRKLVLALVLMNSLAITAQLPLYQQTNVPQNRRIKDLMSRMTLEDKVNVLVGVDVQNGATAAEFVPVVGNSENIVPGCAGITTPLVRLGIPSIVLADGPAGVRISPVRKNDTKTYYATGFPIGSMLSSTWNTELMENVGTAIGIEDKEYGVDVHLAPALNIMRNPLCGRNFEYYSEDPLLTGKMAAAYTRGIQKNGVTACLKHFAANNSETNRDKVDAHVSQRALREIYLRGFEIAVKEGGVGSIMTSYNKINGVYTSADYDLLTTIVRGEWNFKGTVMTDWFGGITKIPYTDGSMSNTSLQIKSGNDLLMPGTKQQREELLNDVKLGKLPLEYLDKCVERVLNLIFNAPSFQGYEKSDSPDLKSHASIALDAAREGMVLLENKSDALPLASSIKKLATFGYTSFNYIAGGTGSGEVNKAYIVPFTGALSDAGYTIDKNLGKLYTPYVDRAKEATRKFIEKYGALPLTMAPELPVNIKTIEKAARTNDAAIITIGRISGEFSDRKAIKGDFLLSDTEQELIENVTKAFHEQNKKVVVVLNIGGVIETASWKHKPDAVLLAWQAGQETGNSVVDILSGKVNPSGKLPMSFPVNYEDNISAKNFPGVPADDPKDIYYEDGIYVGYRYHDSFGVKPSYEFGYGISYTTFDYSNIRLSSTDFGEELYVTVDVKNTGKVAGKEIVQLYLSAPQSDIDKPVKELRAFVKTKMLQAGETQTVYMRLTARDLASFNPNVGCWVADKGTYGVSVGASVSDIRVKASFVLPQNITIEKVNNVLNCKSDLKELRR